VQRLRFFIKGGKVTALFRVIIALTSAEDLKGKKRESLENSYVDLIVGVRIPYRLSGESPSFMRFPERG